jgi:iron complex outermembrane receptor protein
MKNYRLFIFIPFFLACVTQVFAQKGSLKGIVTSSDGKPAPFVSILLKETSKGINSDDRGEFSISQIKPGNYTLVASFVGYKTLQQQIKIEDNKTLNLSLELFENAETLREIVVKGYLSQNNRVVSVGKIAVKSMDLPIAIQTIDKSVLDAQQVNSMQDALMNTNGVYISGSTGGYQEEISGRGFSFGSDNTFKNGTRFMNTMMPEMSSIERIEVLKGSAALLFGNVAAGGVINLVTKKPKFDFGGEVALRMGSFGLIKPSFDIFGGIGKSEKVAFRINGTYQKANSFRQFVSSERFYINPSILFRLGKKTELLLEGDLLDDSRTPDFGTGIVNYEVVENYPRNRFLGVKWGYVDSKQASATTTLTHKFSEKWKLTATSSYRDTEQKLFSAARPNTGTIIKADGTWVRNLQKSDNFNTYFIAQADLTGELNTGKIKHQILIGFDTDHFTQKTQAYSQFARYDTLSIFEDLPADVRNDIPSMTKSTFTNNPTHRYGAYIQDLIHFSEKLKFLTGVRYTNQKAVSDVTAANGTVTTTVTPATGAFSPRLGLVFQPTRNHSAFASYSNSFVLNTGVDVIGNSLPPSYINQYEIGVKNELFANKASLNVTVYRIDNSNLAQISLANGNTNANIKELAGYVRSKGIEIDFAARPIKNLNLMAGYSYNETRYVKSNTFVEGSLLRYNPNHTANTSLQYRITENSLKGLSFGFTSAYIGKRYAGRSTRVQVVNDAYKITPVPAYFQFDATAGYSLGRFALKTKLANIFNVLSYNVHDDNSVNPIAPRNYSATIEYHF